GGAYVPLDPSYPAERLAFMLADAAVPVLIADQSMASSLPAHGLPLIELDQWLGRVARQASAASPSPVVEAGWLSPQQLAYVVYTSGSTGRPKGVRVSHSGVVRLVKETRYADLGPSEILLQAAPVSFDASTFEIWGALLNGGRLVALSQKTPSLAEYGRALESRRISTIFVTTALFQQLVDQQLPSLRGLRQLLTGGEVMPLPPVRRMLAELPEVELIHCYGPTENTTFTTCGSLGDQHAIGPVSVPIGRSITNSETCVLDGQLRPVPIGFAGELYNGGVGLARDYHDRPGLTASRFVPHPHGQVPGARLYRTGDLVRVLADGRIDFLSRADHQVKLRGFRIEPGEIESVLLEQADIRQAAVVLRQDGAIGRRLVAYVAPDSPSEATTADEWLRSRLTALRVDLEARLPGFMIPSAIVALPTLPLSPTHKVDRSKLAALPAPEIDPASSKDYVAPRTPTEDLLANVWTAVLGREAISVTDDFFDLGGHSLLAIGLLSQVREVFEVDLPIAALFERPTIRQLAADIESVGRSALLPPIEAGADEDNPPLSFAQERFWLLEQLSRGTNAYCVPMALRLRGQLQQQALSAAFDALRVRHRVLRAIFPSRAGKPRQVIEPWQSQSLPLIDLRQLGESRRETELQRLVDEDTLRPFDVARGPLMRCILVRVGDQSHALLLNFHHIITDGWALGVLIREVVGLYQAFARRQPSPLPPLPIQYADFARWQKRWMSGEALDRLLGYWRTQLGERGPQLVLPGQRRPEPGTAPRPADGGFDLSPDIGRALDDVSRAHGVTLFMTGLAVFAALLARYSGRRRVIVGTPIANRNRAETEHLVGCFTNTLALAIDLGGDPTFAELLGRVRTVCLGAYAHQDLPFEKLVEAQNPDRDRQSALFDAFFSLSMSDLLRLELDELEIEPLDARQGGMLGGKFDLSAAIFPSDAAFTVGMTYDRELYPKGLIDRLLHDFRRILGAVAEHPETLLSQLPGPTLQERQQLTEALRQKPTAPPAKPASETPRPAPEGSSEGHDVAARRSKLEQSLAKLPPALRAKFAARLAKKPTVEKARMIEPRGTAGPAPLSLAQERLWFLDRLDPEAATYNVPLAARLQGAVDVGALGRALRRVLRRHEILRSRFGVDESHAPFQQTGPPPATVLPVIDLGTVRHRVEAARALMRREAARPFDLERGPVARFSLVRLASDDAYLMMTFHHIVFDAWSSELVFRELAAFYAAEHEQRPAAMPELAIQYADFAVWQRRWLAGERLEKQVDYWQRQLAGAPAVLALPTDRPPGTSRTFHGQSYEFQLPVGLGSALARLKERSQATSFMVLLAAYQVFLQRLTGADDLTVGTPVSGRGQRETEGLVGFFVNILALRGQLDETWTFDQLLERVRRTTLEAYEHQDVPLSKLVEALRPERVAGQAPFFQVVLMVESTPAGFEMSGSTVAIEPLAPPVAKSDLTLAFSESPDGLSAVIEYNTDRFDPTTIRRWAADVSRLVDAALRDPSQRLAALPSSSAAERHAVLWEWNDNTIERHRETSFHGLFAEQARRTPDAIAVVGESAVGVAVGRGATAPAEELLSYGALDRRAEALARRLVDLGVGPDRCLALGLRPAAPMLVALFGVLKAGGAYLPLDPEQPAERSRFMLRDAGVESLITSQDLVAHWQSLAPDVACLSLDELTLDSTVEPAAPRRPVPVRPDHLAYVIYTSGSTGRPKGVMVRHRSLCNLVRIFQERVLAPYAGRRLQVAMMSSLVFDASLAQILSLLDGHTLHVLPDEVRRDVRLMVERLQRQPLDVLNFTPSHLRVAVESGLLSEPRLTPSLLLAGGEAMGDGLRQQLAETPGLTAYNMYGPTESTVDASGCTVRSATSGSDIGRPLANIRAYVLDSRGRSVALGRPGELCVAGVALARGYLARPGLTAERFVPHPYGAKGERLYRTGDLARWRPDGRLECLGRLDHQVKVRGFRIELGEIESALTAQPAVRQSVVRVDQDAAGEPRLVAYAVASTEARVPATLDISALRQALRQRLPEHMVPAAIVELDAFPRTSGDKIDRRALPAPEQASGSGGIEVAAPRDDLELQLVALFEEALSRRPLGIHDDFFALGGHSLLAVRLMARVEETLDTRLPLSTLFEAPTVAALAGLVRRPGNGASAPRQALVPIQRGGAARPFFCVHPVGGNVMCYAALARHLGPEQPFYGLQTPALNGSETHRIEEMAASYLVAVRTIQPEGPYALGGWSMGGWVAFEMARQLEAEGQAVDTLALIDSAAPSQAATGESITAATRVETFARDLAGQWAAESRPAWPDLAQLDEEKALAALHAEARRTGALPPGLALPEVRDLYRLFAFNLQAAERYVGGTYGGRVSLLSAARGAGASAVDRTLGWSTLAGARVEARSLEGDHYSLLHEPQVAAVAAWLGEQLTVSGTSGDLA
ncbi:MAG: amino acid adenylation domain-containing protein, partial [Acidobacteriota bacterium]